MDEVGKKDSAYDVFIAVSYKPACVSAQGNTKGYRHQLEDLTNSFEKLGLQVYLAPREEEWGDKRPPRDVGIRKDFAALREAKIFVFFLSANEADGALVELGVALGLRKAIWILRRPSETLPSYLTGILQLELACEKEINYGVSVTDIVREIAIHGGGTKSTPGAVE